MNDQSWGAGHFASGGMPTAIQIVAWALAQRRPWMNARERRLAL